MSVKFSSAAEQAVVEKKIAIDFTDTRRKSFFPEGFVSERDPNSQTAAKVLECNEDDSLFMYMGVGAGDKSVHEQPLKRFCTGSKYIGQWNRLGISGKGLYRFPHGVIYDGYFNKDGEFHGTGALVYPNGARIEGIWKNGKITEDTNFITEGGVTMSENYCVMPDRRFQVEVENDFHPPGQEYLTNEQPPPRELPDGCFDMVEGFFDPRTKTIYSYQKELTKSKSKLNQSHVSMKSAKSLSASAFLYAENEKKADDIHKVSTATSSEFEFKGLMKRKMCETKKVVSWIPSPLQEDWILKNCRKAWDTAIGYRPDLYEEWTKGGTGFTTLTSFDEGASDFQSKLETLKMSVNPSDSQNRRLLSFVQKLKERQDSVEIEMLTKMFYGKSLPKRAPNSKEITAQNLEHIQKAFFNPDPLL